jgi:hypothetical protein
VSRLALSIALSLLAGAAQAQVPVDPGATVEGPQPWVVGVYTPRVFFPNSLARNRYATSVAAALQSATGQPFRGRAFAASGAFGGQVEAGAVHFAVVEAQMVIERGYPALAQGTSGGRSARPMVLVTAGGKGANVGALSGRSLARVVVGKGDANFVSHFLLQGQVPSNYFKVGKTARDVQGALSLVRLGKADVTLTYAGATGGLSAVFRSRPAPLPVFVRTGAAVPAEVVAAVRGAITGVKVDAGVFDGFSGYDAKALAPLRRALAAGGRAIPKLVFSGAREELPPVSAYVGKGGAPPVRLPDAARSLGTLDPPPDLL